MKEKIFNFNNIENEILKLEKLEQNKENHCLRELKLFKEFSDENFLINKQSNTNLLNNY
ncbi:hypothetical protein J6W34_02920 [bacterium]|nr:hypothetical protein [bacterium]